MEILKNQSCYVNPNTRQLTSNRKNAAIKDRAAFNCSMQNPLNPVEDLAQALKTPIKLPHSSYLNKQSNSVDIASGKRIVVNDGYILTVKPQGVEVSGGDNPYDMEAYMKAQKMAGSLATLLRNACGNMHTVASSQEKYSQWTEGVSDVMGYLGIDTSKDFTVNGMKYSKNEKGWFESRANSNARTAYERLKANNRTYTYADEKTRKQIAYISNYYLENTTESMKKAWQKTLEETGVNPFPQGFSSTLSQLAMEQDFATGGNDDIFGSDLDSNMKAVKKIIERLENPLGAVTEENAEFYANEKKFYTVLLNNLSSSAGRNVKPTYEKYESENYRIVPDNEAGCFDIYNKQGERLGAFEYSDIKVRQDAATGKQFLISEHGTMSYDAVVVDSELKAAFQEIMGVETLETEELSGFTLKTHSGTGIQYLLRDGEEGRGGKVLLQSKEDMERYEALAEIYLNKYSELIHDKYAAYIWADLEIKGVAQHTKDGILSMGGNGASAEAVSGKY